MLRFAQGRKGAKGFATAKAVECVLRFAQGRKGAKGFAKQRSEVSGLALTTTFAGRAGPAPGRATPTGVLRSKKGVRVFITLTPPLLLCKTHLRPCALAQSALDTPTPCALAQGRNTPYTHTHSTPSATLTTIIFSLSPLPVL